MHVFVVVMTVADREQTMEDLGRGSSGDDEGEFCDDGFGAVAEIARLHQAAPCLRILQAGPRAAVEDAEAVLIGRSGRYLANGMAILARTVAGRAAILEGSDAGVGEDVRHVPCDLTVGA